MTPREEKPPLHSSLESISNDHAQMNTMTEKEVQPGDAMKEETLQENEEKEEKEQKKALQKKKREKRPLKCAHSRGYPCPIFPRRNQMPRSTSL